MAVAVQVETNQQERFSDYLRFDLENIGRGHRVRLSRLFHGKYQNL